MKELLRKKSVKISLLLIILLVVMGIVGINVQSAQKNKEYEAHIAAAEKYLSDLDYEQAIAEYTMAFEIEPKEEVVDALEQTYLAYAQTCIDVRDYEKAVGILEEGYEKIGRESLQEMIEELQKIMEEIAQNEEIKQLVESDEFQEKITEMCERIGNAMFQHITDEQLEELCWPLIEALEKYRELYGDLENLRFFRRLPQLYLLVGEFELCAEIRKELYELDPEHLSYLSSEFSYSSGNYMDHYENDEYGRIVTRRIEEKGRLQEENFEYGENGKVEKFITRTEEDDGRTDSEIQVYEYDSEGRVSVCTSLLNATNTDGAGGVLNMETTVTYTYGSKGFTEHRVQESTFNGLNGTFRTNSRSTTDYEIIDDYGHYEQIGEPYDVYREENRTEV